MPSAHRDMIGMRAQRGAARANLLANYLGSGLTAAMAIVMSPIYLRLLGPEAFGLIGLFNAVVAFSSIFEMGITTAVIRQLARLEEAGHRDSCEAIATLERIFTGIGVLLGTILCVAGPMFAMGWLNPQALDADTITWSMIWLAVGFTCRWNISFYGAGLTGMERLLGLNVLAVIVALFQYLGVIVVLYLWRATPPVFFAYMACCGLAQMLVLRWMLWRLIGWAPDYRSWHPPALRPLRSFAGGMSLVTLTSICLGQVDKVILGRLMPLAGFGLYAFAANTASGTQRVVGPIYSSILPRMTRLVSTGDREGAMGFYQTSAQAVACLLAPMVVTGVVFCGPLLRVWTGDPELAGHIAPVLSLFLLGNLLNGLMHVPLALLLAHGRTAVLVWSNVVSIVVLAPACILAFGRHGAAGVAAIWCVLNLGYVIIQVPVMHRILAWPGMWRWYAYGVVLPLLASGTFAGLAYWRWHDAGDPVQVLMAAVTALFSTCMLGLLLPGMRRLAVGRLGTLLPWSRHEPPGAGPGSGSA